MADVVDRVVRRSHPGPCEVAGIGPVFVPVGTGPGFQDFEEILRSSYDDRNGENVLTARPSPPLWNVSFSPGGRGTRRGNSPPRLGWSLVLPGNDAKESTAMRPGFFASPTGAPEKVRTEMALMRIEPSLPPFCTRVALISSGPVSESFRDSVRIFSQSQEKEASRSGGEVGTAAKERRKFRIPPSAGGRSLVPLSPISRNPHDPVANRASY
jgi:hypothetical protein